MRRRSVERPWWQGGPRLTVCRPDRLRVGEELAKTLSLRVAAEVGVQRSRFADGVECGICHGVVQPSADQVPYSAVHGHLHDRSFRHARRHMSREGIARFVVVVVGVEQRKFHGVTSAIPHPLRWTLAASDVATPISVIPEGLTGMSGGMQRWTNWATLWESVADAMPEGLAMVRGQHRLRWAELDDRASRLAAALDGTRPRTTVQGGDRGVQHARAS